MVVNSAISDRSAAMTSGKESVSDGKGMAAPRFGRRAAPMCFRSPLCFARPLSRPPAPGRQHDSAQKSVETEVRLWKKNDAPPTCRRVRQSRRSAIKQSDLAARYLRCAYGWFAAPRIGAS